MPKLFAGSGTATPRHETNRRGASKRKQTLLSLLDALNELTNDEETFPKDSSLQPNFQDDRDVPTVDEYLQTIGAESFARFERNMINFDKQLRNFSNAARQLGSSVGILSSAYRLRERVAMVVYLFHENAADLFPRKVRHQDMATQASNVPLRTKRHRSKPPPNVRTPVVTGDLDPEDFPKQMAQFAEDIVIFLECLNEFPEFTDEAVNASILAFQGDLKYWASCLGQYTGQFKYPAVQRYLHDLSSDLGEHIESITSALFLFIEVGVPTIRFAQEHGAHSLLNLSTIATFFSSVTATSLQFSFSDTHSAAANAVNAFWFTSLVFSIAAAVNSLLGLTWKQAMYRSPRHLVPWWVSMWIKRSPLMFLVLSVACFSAGLVAFAYSSSQHYVTSTLTTVFSAFASFGLAAVSAWFASERMVFNRHKGRKWLAEILEDSAEKIEKATGYKWMKNTAPKKSKTALSWSARVVRRATIPLRRMGAIFGRSSVSAESTENDEPAPPPYASPTILPLTGITSSPRSGFAAPSGPTVQFRLDQEEERDSGETSTRPSDASPVPPAAAPEPEVSATRARFMNLVRSAIMVNRLIGIGDEAKARVSRSLTDGKTTSRKPEAISMPRSSRVAGLVPRLQNMAPTQDIAAHAALVRHMEFSPDGKFLATSSWDRTSVIFHVGDQFTSHRVLLHPTGFVGQVAWSPSGNLIMTKLPRAIKIWTQDGVCRKTIERPCSVQSMTWLPHGEAFLSVEESSIVRLDINGTVLDTYEFERISLQDAAVTSDCARLFTVGTMSQSLDGSQPSRSRNEKQIITYNLDQKQIENRVPVLNEVRDITISQNDQFVLVSYENKAPPQLWKVEMVKRPTACPDTPPETVARLSLRHTYMPKTPVDFAGPSYFGGKDDQLIMCAGKAGDIYIWDRESGALLHHIRAQVVGGDLTCVAWNPAADPFMFATGSHDGAVRIWTTLDRSALPSPYPEFTFQSEGRGGGTPRTRSPSIFPQETDNRVGLSSTEGGLKAHELRASLDELGAQLRAVSR